MTTPISYWHDSLQPGDALTPRAALPGDLQTDVAVVGAGFAGLWTAYYLLKANPSLRVVVIDAQTAGFGASGRNGGWCVPEAGSPLDVLDKEGGAGTGAAMLRAMHRAVDEVGDVARRENIDCGYAKGGALWLASDAAQLRRLRSRFAVFARHGLGEEYQLLNPIKTIARSSPSMLAVYASVARTTTSATMVPCGVTTRRPSIRRAGVISCTMPPSRSTARARPRASRAGCTAAAWGV